MITTEEKKKVEPNPNWNDDGGGYKRGRGGAVVRPAGAWVHVGAALGPGWAAGLASVCAYCVLTVLAVLTIVYMLTVVYVLIAMYVLTVFAIVVSI